MKWTVYNHQISTGSLRLSQNWTLPACHDHCVQDTNCVAVDFVSSRYQCWVHTNVDNLKKQNTSTGVSDVTQYRLNRTCDSQRSSTPFLTRGLYYVQYRYWTTSILPSLVGCLKLSTLDYVMLFSEYIRTHQMIGLYTLHHAPVNPSVVNLIEIICRRNEQCKDVKTVTVKTWFEKYKDREWTISIDNVYQYCNLQVCSNAA